MRSHIWSLMLVWFCGEDLVGELLLENIPQRQRAWPFIPLSQQTDCSSLKSPEKEQSRAIGANTPSQWRGSGWGVRGIRSGWSPRREEQVTLGRTRVLTAVFVWQSSPPSTLTLGLGLSLYLPLSRLVPSSYHPPLVPRLLGCCPLSGRFI